MKDEEIILKSFNKAIENGFALHEDFSIGNGYPDPEYYYDCDDGSRHSFRYYPWPFYGIIFSHDFAKSFWKDDKKLRLTIIHDGDEYYTQHGESAWQYHLQQMVLESEPLKYLEKFL